MNKHIQKFIFLFILTILHGKNDHMASVSENRNNSRQQLHTVAAGNYYYQPSMLSINVGDTVRFINETGFHDVEVTVGPELLSLAACNGPCTIGDLIFDTAGDYEYICSIGSHAAQGMIGTISVSETEVTFQPQTKEQLQTAVNLWISDNSSALSTYGEINAWDVSLITDMSYLFEWKTSFNDDIINWDVSNVVNMEGMFQSANAFNKNIGGWDVSNVINMKAMFLDASSFNQDLSNWNTANVANTAEMFRVMFSGASEFNGDITSWNVSSLINASQMFRGAENFNQDISSWDVSNVTNMWGMFYDASTFNQDISDWQLNPNVNLDGIFDNPINGESALSDANACAIDSVFSLNNTWPYDWSGLCSVSAFQPQTKEELQTAVNLWFDDNALALSTYGEIGTWDVSLMTDLGNLFYGKTAFNGDIGNWDVSNVTDMNNLFNYCMSFNQNLSNWDVSKVTTMESMFHGAFGYNEDLSSWDVSSVTNMQGMFFRAASYNQDLSMWDVSNVTNMKYMFYNASSFNQDLIGWDVSSVTTMAYMFGFPNYSTYGISVFNGDISSWDVSNVTDMEGMFIYALDYNRDLSNWNVSNVTNMSKMFKQAFDFNQDISGWDISSVTDMSGMFDGGDPGDPDFNLSFALSDENKCSIHNSFSINDNWPYDWSGLCPVAAFQPATKAELQTAVNLWVDDNASALSTYGEINTWDVSLITDMSALFQFKTAFNDDIGNWDVSNATNMNAMFLYATSFNQDISNWDVSSVANMGSMFNNAQSFNGDISNWDVSSVSNMGSMFNNAQSFNGDISNWDVSNLSSMVFMFWGATNFNQNLSSWNVSGVTDMEGVFQQATAFNGDISAWDVSNVTRAQKMFYFATNFNGDISNWDVSSLTSASYMFSNASNFNQDISTWDVSNVSGMSMMFMLASNFNQDISSWNVSSATNMDLMFDNADNLSEQYKCNIHASFSTNENWPYDWSGLCPVVAFQPATKAELQAAVNAWVSDSVDADAIYGHISDWDVSLVIYMNHLFQYKDNFNSDISNWDVSNVVNMHGMFENAFNFNQDLSSWDVSSVTNMTSMFTYAESFNQDLSLWNVSNVNLTAGMFAGAAVFNSDISSWDVSNVTNTSTMFQHAISFNQDLSSWDVSSVTNMERMFADAAVFNGDISNWNVSNVTNMVGMFSGAAVFNSDISSWDVSSVGNINSMFNNAVSFNQNLSSWNVSSVGSMVAAFIRASAFNGNISSWDVSNVYNMSDMFREASLFNQDLSLWNVTSVTNMNRMFKGASSFNQDLSSLDISNVSTMIEIFDGAIGLSNDNKCLMQNSWSSNSNWVYDWSDFCYQPQTRAELQAAVNAWVSDSVIAESEYGHISAWDVSLINNMSNLFFNKSTFNSDLSNWDVSNVTDMSYMFKSSAFNGDISDWNTSSVTNMNSMFSENVVFDGDLSSWDVSSVADMTAMFRMTNFYGDLSAWNTSNVTSMTMMFDQSNFDSDISSWDVSSVTSFREMFRGSPFNHDLSNWDVSSGTNFATMFGGAQNFNSDISNWNVSSGIYFTSMFGSAQNFNSDISNWNVSSGENFANMFKNADNFNSNISGWNVSSATNMKSMFERNDVFNGDLSNWDVSNVTDMSYMFKSSAFNGDISDWNTSSVTNMNSMFSENVVFDGDLSSWDVSSVVDMTAMFRMTNFYGDLSAWNTSNVTSMTMMFDQSDFDSDISSWDVSSVTSFREMFRGSPFNHDLSNWDVSSGTNFSNMFTSSNISESNKCAIHTSFFINDAWPYDWSIYCNEPPMVQGMEISLDEDVAYTGFLIGSDLDVDDVLNYFIVTQPLNGTITQSTELDSNFTYTPDSNFFGDDLFTFVAYDDSVYSDTAIVLILVHPINDAPVVDSDSMVYLLEDGDVFYQMTGTDVDDNNLTFFQVEGPFHGDYDVATDIYTPFPNYFGSDMFTYIAMDTSGFESELATVTFHIEAVDDPPFVDSYLDTIYLVEDFQDPISYELDSMFTDIDGLMTYTVQLADPSVVSASVWGGGRLVVVSIPDANGMTEMIITASNPTRASVSDTVMVMVEAVNDMPVIIVSDTSMYEDGHLAIQVQASDIDGDDIHYLDVHFDPEVVDGYFFGGDSLMIHSIVEHWNGSVSVHVEVGDGDFVVHEHFTVSVLPVNDAPYFVSPMHAPVGLGLEFDLPLHIMDVDSQFPHISLTEGAENPSWVMIDMDDLHEYTLLGIPDSLGHFPVYLTLTDGEAIVVDTFDIHVVHFKPEIVSIEDIPNDQGGEIYIRFNRSFLDNGMEMNQTYGVFRLDSIGTEHDWVLVQSGPATGEDYYYYQVPSLRDSSIHGDGMTHFKVVASMNNGIFDSEPAMGYSVDNIVPMVPTGMLAASVDNYISIRWDMSPDEDFQYFELVRRGGIGDDIVIELIETSYDDFNIDAGIEYSYKLAAYDYNGNFSGYSEPVLISMLSADDNGLVPAAYALNQNYPNPFNPTTQIEYELPKNGYVSIDIYDVMGYKIKSLVSSNQEAGYKSVVWNATNDLGQPVSAGMYIYAIQAGKFRQTRKMVLLK